jgi:hypothetical protein
MKSGKYDKAFFNYLMSIDCDNYDFTNNRPLTKFYDEMKEANTPPIAKFYEELTYDYTENIIEINNSTLYELFNNYIKNNNYKIEYTNTKFSIDSKKIEGIQANRDSKRRYYKININELKKGLTKKFNIIFSNEEETINNNEIPKEEPTKINNDGIFKEGSGLDEIIMDGVDSNDMSHFK